jgi:hypothetical protein
MLGALETIDARIVTGMAKEVGDIRDSRVGDRLYALAEPQGGYFAAQQAVDVGIHRSTLSYHAREGGTAERVGHGVYRLRRFPASPHERVIPAWLGLSRADGRRVARQRAGVAGPDGPDRR